MFISALPGTAGVWLRKGGVAVPACTKRVDVSIAGTPSLTSPLLMSDKASINSSANYWPSTMRGRQLGNAPNVMFSGRIRS